MYKIEIEVYEIEAVDGLFKLVSENEDIDIITEKNFNGDLTTIELYISLSINLVAVLVPIIKALIKQKKVSSLKLEGEKIEVSNVSQELIEKILREKMQLNAKESKNDPEPEVTNEKSGVNNPV